MLCSALLSLTLHRWDTFDHKPDDAEAHDGSDAGNTAPSTLLILVRQNRRVRGLILFQILDAVKEGPLSALFPVLMLGVVGASSAEMGLANSAFAASAVIAGPLIGTVVKRFGYRLTVLGGAAVANILIVILVIRPSFPIAAVVFFLSGLPFTMSWVGGQTWLLLTAPKVMRGRVVGTSGAVYSGLSLITMLGSGALAEAIGAQWVIGIAATVAIVGLVAVHVLLRSTADPTALRR